MNLNTLFPDEREQGDTVMRQSQLVMLRLLRILDYLCAKHNVSYFLVAGTLLGAIRHKGFIPWDDDLDIGMTRKEYERFEKLVVPELPNDIFFQSPETDPHYPSCYKVEAKLRDKYSSYTVKERKEKPKWHHGLMLDIMVYDRAFLPHNAHICALNRLMMKLYWGKKPNNQGNKKRGRFLTIVSKLTPYPLVYSNMFIRQWNMVKKQGPNYFTHREIKDVVRAEFEGLVVAIPKGWETYLKRKYGDYMKLPPVEKQKNHHGSGLPKPFTACGHAEALQWSERVKAE